MYNFYRG